MAKPKRSTRAAKKPATGSSLAGVRTKIDRIDQELVTLVNERAKLAQQIGKVKEQNGHHAYDPARECEVLAPRGGPQ